MPNGPTITRKQLEKAKIEASSKFSIARRHFVEDEQLSLQIHQKPQSAAETLRYIALLCNQAADNYSLIAKAKKEGVLENAKVK